MYVFLRTRKQVGLCVNVQPNKYIYTGGEETGAVVELINYPKFPEDKDEIRSKAWCLAVRLRTATQQHSVLMMTPDETRWLSERRSR